MRVAAIDCGTNTIKLLVADLDPTTGHERDLVREMRIVRLGEGVDRTGRLDGAAMQRTFAAIDEYAGLIEEHSVDALRFCATSASRDAENSGEFVSGVRSRLGIEPEVVSGAVEAQLAYDGATRSLDDVEAPILVLDIGGGSTELILGDAHGHVTSGHSLDIGSVRLTERLMVSDPPAASEVESAAWTVDDALDTLHGHGIDPGRAGTLVGVAGTITTVAAGVLDLPSYDRGRIHHSVLPADPVHEHVDRLLAMTVAERRRLPYMHPGRADVIAAGALILDRVLRRVDLPSMLVSEADILDGIAWSMAAEDGPASA